MKNLFRAALILFMAVITVNAYAQPPRQGRDMDPEKMAEMITERIDKSVGLSEAQKKQVYDLNLERMSRMRGQRNDEAISREQVRVDFEKEKGEYNTRLKAILTPEQYQKFEESQPRHKRADGERNNRKDNKKNRKSHTCSDNCQCKSDNK